MGRQNPADTVQLEARENGESGERAASASKNNEA